MSEFKWSKPDERKPENGEKYLLCDWHGDISVGFWSDEKTVKLYEGRQEYVKKAGFYKTKGDLAAAIRNIYFFADLPEVPAPMKQQAKEAQIERKIEALKKQLADLRAEAVMEEA